MLTLIYCITSKTKILKQKESRPIIVPASPKTNLELTILAPPKRQKKKQTLKCNRIRRKFAESLTSGGVLKRMKIETEARALKPTNKNKTRKTQNKDESSSGSEVSLNFDGDLDMDPFLEEKKSRRN